MIRFLPSLRFRFPAGSCLVLVLALVGAPLLPAQDAQQQADRDLLRRRAVAAEVAAWKAYVQGHVPSRKLQNELSALVEDLAAPDFRTRHRAMERLRTGDARTWFFLVRLSEETDPERRKRLETCRRELASRVDRAALEAAVRLLGDSADPAAWPPLWSLLPFCPDPLLEAETAAALARLEFGTRGRPLPPLPANSPQQETVSRTLREARRKGTGTIPAGPTRHSLEIGERFLQALARGQGRQASALIVLPFFLGETFHLKNSEEACQAFGEVRQPLTWKVLYAGPVADCPMSPEEARFLEGLPAWSVRAVHVVVRSGEDPPREGALFVRWHPGPPRLLGLGTKGK